VILVDTSVWIGYLRGAQTTAIRTLDQMLADEMPFALTGVIYQEILQGADSNESYARLADYFGSQRFLHPVDNIETYALAAAIYMRCRRAGVTIRSTIDCLIAQIAIEHGAGLLHDDRDFVQMASVVSELELVG